MQALNFYAIAIGFAVGIFTGSLWSVTQADMLWILTLSFVVVVIGERSKIQSSKELLRASSVCLAALAVGMAWFTFQDSTLTRSNLLSLENQKTTLNGIVSVDPDQRTSALNLIVQTESGKVLVRTDRYADIRYGDEIVMQGTIEVPETFETDLGRTFNYPGYLRARSVTHSMSFAEVEVLSRDNGNAVVSELLSFKHKLMDSFSAFIPEPQAGLGAGLLLGVKQALGDDLETAFRRTGIIHIVVLSGYNVMIVAEAIMRLLAVFFRVRTRVVIGIVAIAGFALMVGLSATVLRASVMAVLVLIARATGRHYAIMRALTFAGLVMLVVNPHLLVFDPGFQLSFLATMGLIVVAPHIEKLFGFVPSTLQVREFLTATISTQIFVLPLLLFLIGEFSVVSVLVNVLVLPMVPLAMLLVFLTGMIGFALPQLGAVIAIGAFGSLLYITSIATWFNELSFAAFTVPAFPFWLTIISYVGIVYVLWRLHRRNTPSASVGIGMLGGMNEWTIEEESEVTKSVADRRSATQSSSQTPIFFR